VRQMNMIKFSMDDFEAATRQYADQSLAYGKGKEVEYNFAAVQRWVLDNVAGNVPKIEAMLRMFPFAGEGQGIRDIIGGIQQEEMATELAEMIASEELNTLTLQRLALTRVEETIGFLDRMSAEDPEMIFGKYCMDALLMDEDTMLDFGSPASNVRTAIRLKHLKSLYTLLRNLLIDPIAKISEPYTVPLTEGQEQRLREAVTKMESKEHGGATGNLKTLIEAFKSLLLDYHLDFAEPCPPRTGTDEEPTPLATEWEYSGWLENVELKPKRTGPDGFNEILASQPWFQENFPLELTTTHLKATYQLLCKINDEGVINTVADGPGAVDFQAMKTSSKISFWEQNLLDRKKKRY